MPKQRDIVLISFPFTDLSSTKKRPAIVISNDGYNYSTKDMIVVGMTSNPDQVPYSFGIINSDLEIGKLQRPGRVRVDKIYCLSQSLIVKTFGKVANGVLDNIRRTLADLVKT